MNKRRSSIQLEQEKKSRLQLEECLSDFGWHLSSPSPDLGEDFIVEIYHDGQNAGVTFYIQEKSVTNLYTRKTKDNRLVYNLKVKDLKHWEGFSLPVVIFIWDINLREGKWTLVKSLISSLDKDNPKWRKNKSDVQVYVPWENGTDFEGLKKLKIEIGRQVYPLISFGKDLAINMKLVFPKTPSGLELQKAFDLHIKEGEPVTLKGDVIQELRFSDWWERWFGKFDPSVGEVHIGELSQDRRVPISFRIISGNEKTVSLSNLEFRPIRVGTELIKFSNEHTLCPFLITFSMRRVDGVSQGSLTYLIRHVGGEPHEILQFLDFAKAIAKGGNLRVTFHDINESTSTNFPPTDQDPIDLFFYDLVRKLVVIEDKTGHFLKIPNEGISRKDAQAISELFEIVGKGIHYYTDMVMTLEFNLEGLRKLLELHKSKKSGEPVQVEMDAPESYVELFKEKIQTGPMTRRITGFWEISIQELENKLIALSLEESVELKLVKVSGTETFSNWIPKVN